MSETEHHTDSPRGFLEALQYGKVARFTLGVVLVFVIAMLFPKGLEYQYEYREGDIWVEDDLIAPFGFSIYRDEAVVEKEQKQAAESTPLSFERLPSMEQAMLDTVTQALRYLASTAREATGHLSRRYRRQDVISLADSLARSAARDPKFPARLPQRYWRYWMLNWTGGDLPSSMSSILEITRNGMRQIYQRGYLDREKSSFSQEVLAIRVDSTTELRKPVKDFYDHIDVAQVLQNLYYAGFNRDSAKVECVFNLVYPLLQPNVRYDNAQTQFAIQAARNYVMRTDGIVKENERIISRHERISPEIKAKLDSYMRAKSDRTGDVNQLLQFLGRVGHTIAILFLPVMYIFMFRKKIIRDNSRLLLIAIIILLIAFLSYLTYTLPVTGPVQYLIIVPTAAMLLTVIFDSRVAYYTTVSISFLVGALRGNEYAIILASILAGSLAIYTVRDVKNRSQIFRSLMFIFSGYVFAILINGLQRGVPVEEMAIESTYALVNSVLSPVFTFGLLIFFERVFRISTDLTLLELSDFNHPLLRDLSSRAPGTFHHSIVMGTLAEAAATSIGANATLARVGAYYHDIGKMLEPEYFVENQISNQNVHDTLEPKDSARKIIDHVIRGIELAKEYNLPDRVIQFIPAHHGTTLVSYFYEKEKSLGTGEVQKKDFQYLGPKPYSKETGIVMLADTIEAATRAIEEPTIDRIRELIDKVVSKRLADGELENCDLTFRELTTIKLSFLNILTGIHHSRIKYPSEEDAAAAKKIADRTAKLLNLPSTTDALMQRMKKLDSF
ncbi:MAG: HDIG domain-containing protein [Bacteroidetes bacterium]|nr:HDIG domain-containing protein [Bacteroidota bacterium]